MKNKIKNAVKTENSGLFADSEARAKRLDRLMPLDLRPMGLTLSAVLTKRPTPPTRGERVVADRGKAYRLVRGVLREVTWTDSARAAA